MSANEPPPHPLEAQLEEIDRILVAFASPVVDEHAGLRLMHEHLSDRREDIADKLARTETPTLEVVVEGAVAVSGTLPARFVVALGSAVVGALDALAPTNGTAGLRWVGGVPDGAGITLQGPSAPGARAATEVAGRSAAFITGGEALLDAVERLPASRRSGGKGRNEASEREAVAALEALVTDEWVRLELRWTPPQGEPRTVVLDPEALQASR